MPTKKIVLNLTEKGCHSLYFFIIYDTNLILTIAILELYFSNSLVCVFLWIAVSIGTTNKPLTFQLFENPLISKLIASQNKNQTETQHHPSFNNTLSLCRLKFPFVHKKKWDTLFIQVLISLWIMYLERTQTEKIRLTFRIYHPWQWTQKINSRWF